MKIAVTGAGGFLGWHVRCRAFADGIVSVPVGRAELADRQRLESTLRDVDAVIHCAGVTRGTDEEVAAGSIEPARRLRDGLRRTDRPVRVVYANSTGSRQPTGYGVAKRTAADILGDGSVPLSDVILPNLYGEHGRPHHNSFVATFCHEFANGRKPVIVRDREVPILHAQDAAGVLLREARATGRRQVEPAATPVTVTAVFELIREFDLTYRAADLPDITSELRARLFNTYRSHCFPARFPMPAVPRRDERGHLVECVRTAAGGQATASSTEPGAVRGEHVHLRKFERFLVLDGDVEISLRRLHTDEVVAFRVTGSRPAIVDMPTMWAHKMTNVGDRPATTFFWTNEVYSPDDPDTYPCPVAGAEARP